MQLFITTRGAIHCLYGELIELPRLGDMKIARASHVEADGSGRWWADLAPVSGPSLGPFARRSEALVAEARWLERYYMSKMSKVLDDIT